MIRTSIVQRFGLVALCVALAAGCNADSEHTVDTSSDGASYELVRVLEVAGRQGVATDGEYYFVSGSTALYVYSKDGAQIAANEDPFADLEKPANHIGDISVHDGELFAGIEWFVDGRGQDIQIAV